MPALSDATLHSLANAGTVQPYNLNHLGPCSIDLTLGDTIKIESLDDNGDGWVEVDITKPYTLRPKQFVLAHTAEWVQIPNGYMGQVLLRSSAARMGYDHCFAGMVDSGFEGELVLELSNKLQLHSLELKAGMRLVQLVVFKLDAEPFKEYGMHGHYNHQTGVTLSNFNLGSK